MLAVITPRIASAQSIAVKSNVLYDLTGTFNLGGEIRCDDTHSFNLSVNYNPWNLGENKKMKHILIQPEYRWWLNETFIGSFFGVQAHFAQYNFGGTTPFTTVKNNRYQGNLIGCGITYGHQWLLSTFWSLEASISVGYAHLTYADTPRYEEIIEGLPCKVITYGLEHDAQYQAADITYDKYGPAKGDALIKKSHSNYVGPTQLGISFIYFIQ